MSSVPFGAAFIMPIKASMAAGSASLEGSAGPLLCCEFAESLSISRGFSFRSTPSAAAIAIPETIVPSRKPNQVRAKR